MNVLVLAPQPFFQLRGTPIAVRRVVQVLGEAGHSIDLLTFHEGEDVPLPNCTLHRTARLPWVKNVPPGLSFRKIVCDICMLFKAVCLCRSRSFDVVHAVEESVFIARLLKLFFRIPYLYDMDSSLPEQLRDRFPWLRFVLSPLRLTERHAIKNSDGVIAVCHALEDIVHRYSPYTPVLRMEDSSPHKFSDGSSEAAPNEDLSQLAGSKPMILYVGNLQEYQGIDLLLQSFGQVANELPTSRLVIVGGSDANIRKYRTLAEQLGIAERTDFLGPQPLESIPQFIRSSQIVVSPRIQGANTPMKIYSYMESGIPLVATRLETHTQVLNDSICWLEAPNPDAFSSAIIGAWRDYERSKQMAASAQSYAEEHFSAEIQDEKLIVFYEDFENRHYECCVGRGATLIKVAGAAQPQRSNTV